MIKRIIKITTATVLLLAMITACQTDDWSEWVQEEAPEGYVNICFEAVAPDMPEVNTRSVDPDGGGVNSMTLFCFDSYGLFISTATADLKPDTDTTPSLSGSFAATIPENTRRIHFLANQNMTSFEEDNFRNKSEAEVMAVLEGSAGMMIYWARFACQEGNESSIKDQLKPDSQIVLIRNQAKISIANPTSEYFVVAGFTAYNTSAFGTVAPFHSEDGFVWPGNEPYVTLPVNQDKLSDITEVQTGNELYIFECENSSDDPVSIIIRGHLPGQDETKDLYYRVMLIDDAGNQVLVRRNHHYKLNIKGKLSFGQTSFKAALEAAATNNVWLSISDEVNSVEDNNYILTVPETSVVIGEEEIANRTYRLRYTVEGKNNTSVGSNDKAEVSWLDGNTVAAYTFTHNFDVTGGKGNGELIITLNQMGGNQKLEGTLLVKKGRLQRKIKVITVKTQQFIPAWAATQIYGNQIGAHATLMFTIPETCPAELFPMRVLISVPDLDVRHESGMDLPLVREGEEGYGEFEPGWQYKYVYTANAPGVQRIYFENVLEQEQGISKEVTIEADFFETLTKVFTFANAKTEYAISVDGLSEYTNKPEDDFANDEAILYRLVPQKKGAFVQFDLLTQSVIFDRDNKEQKTAINAGKDDEFLLYSTNLDHIKNGEEPDGIKFDCTFYEIPDDRYNTGGRVFMFMPRDADRPTDGKEGHYSIYMRTNQAKSAEVVRIASNQKESVSGLPGNNGNYTGRTYRSVTFELANYNPFRFSARVNGEGEDATGDAEEEITPLSWDYAAPSQKVDIDFDVTSFAGTDNKSADPFGSEFNIYIDAPMLEINEAEAKSRGLSGKLVADPSVSGRFIYKVDADREKERTYGAYDALKKDGIAGVDKQRGERKSLPFMTKNIVSTGNIVISSQEEEVVFFKKTFSVTNESITGKIEYTDGQKRDNVPAGSFVVFERQLNGSRIGSMTVKDNGNYELRLRKEYDFNWNTDKIKLSYTDAVDKVVYSCTVNSLADLFSARNIVLTKAN